MNELDGYDFEDLSPGMSATFAKTITEADIVLFAGASGDNNAMHINEEFARTTPFKGRIAHGVLTIFIPFFGVWATCRLAKPNSPWARRFYHDKKLARSQERYPPDSRTVRWRKAAFNAIGGRVTARDAK